MLIKWAVLWKELDAFTSQQLLTVPRTISGNSLLFLLHVCITGSDGNCSSDIPLLKVAVVKKKICMEELSRESIICPHWHYDTFVPMMARNWPHCYILSFLSGSNQGSAVLTSFERGLQSSWSRAHCRQRTRSAQSWCHSLNLVLMTKRISNERRACAWLLSELGAKCISDSKCHFCALAVKSPARAPSTL